MREIKFRAWDGKKMTREYTLYEMLSFLLPNNGLKHNWLQYTGLKDKNGKKIFDGYIVELFGWGSQKGSDGYAVIGWDDDEIGWNFLAYYHKNNNYLIRINKPNYIQDRYEFRQAIDNCIVIGNIYENPELLDNK